MFLLVLYHKINMYSMFRLLVSVGLHPAKCNAIWEDSIAKVWLKRFFNVQTMTENLKWQNMLFFSQRCALCVVNQIVKTDDDQAKKSIFLCLHFLFYLFGAMDLSKSFKLSNQHDKELDCFPWSSAHSKSSFIWGRASSVNVEAGVVAGQWKASLQCCLCCCPLVNDWAEGCRSFVYTVIKHSKPTGWQQARFLAPRCSAENKTHLMLCFPAPWDPKPKEWCTI